MTPRVVIGAVLAATVLVAGCGGSTTTIIKETSVPPSHTDTATVTTTATQASTVDPNDPQEGTTSYNIYAESWARLTPEQKAAAAYDYVRDNPTLCKYSEPRAIASYVDAAYGRDFPLATLAGRVMEAACSAGYVGE